MLNITASLDPNGQAAMARLMDPELLDPAISNMLKQTAEDMQQAATDYMRSVFIQPGDGVEESWEIDQDSSFLVGLTNTAPYARRLDLGFSGMTDALGRFFPAWPLAYPDGYHWAEAAVTAVRPAVEDLFRFGIDRALEGTAWA